jgi:hypothetical protein
VEEVEEEDQVVVLIFQEIMVVLVVETHKEVQVVQHLQLV